MLVYATALVVLYSATVDVAAVHAQRVPSADSLRDGLTQARLDTSAARLAALELRRAELLAGQANDSLQRQAVDRQITALRHYVDELPDPRAGQAHATRQILRAIEGRLASLAVTRRLLGKEQLVDSPEGRALATYEAALEHRRLELRASLADSRSPTLAAQASVLDEQGCLSEWLVGRSTVVSRF